MTDTLSFTDLLAQEVSGVIKMDGATMAFKDAAKDAEADAVGGRVAMLLAVARLSSEHQATDIQVSTAIKAVLMSYKDNKAALKTVQTLASEIKLAAHPSVRMHTAALYTLCDAAWAAEAEDALLTKSARPIKVAFSRLYHTWAAVLKEASIGRIYSNAEELIAFAKHRDPAYDTDKLVDRHDDIARKLKALMDDCAVPAYANIISDLSQIAEKDIAEHVKGRPPMPILSHGQPDPVLDVSEAIKNGVVQDVKTPKKPLPVTVHSSTTTVGKPQDAVDVLDDIMDKAA
jgi:hypothetical protein